MAVKINGIRGVTVAVDLKNQEDFYQEWVFIDNKNAQIMLPADLQITLSKDGFKDLVFNSVSGLTITENKIAFNLPLTMAKGIWNVFSKVQSPNYKTFVIDGTMNIG
jgi:hypothetical protein